jgi:ribonuclease HII
VPFVLRSREGRRRKIGGITTIAAFPPDNVLHSSRTVPPSSQTVGKRFRLKDDADVTKATQKLRLLKKLKCTLNYEKLAWAAGAQLVAGVDEVGRGCLFGPVVAAAVILKPDYRIRGLRDSKLLDRKTREKLAPRIRENCVAWAVAFVDVAIIDEINIYWASKRAMEEAVAKLAPAPDHLLVDALRLGCLCDQTAILHGDAVSASIAAASIVAKVERDAMIRELDAIYPGYGLSSNVGYRSPIHLKALKEKGPTPLHRMSFAPVWMSAAPQELMEFMVEDSETGVSNPFPVES